MSNRSAHFSLDGKRVFIAGHRGLVGSALLRRLQQEDCTILTAPRQEVDLRRQDDTERWFASNRPDVVIVAAGTVGGMFANSERPADFLYDNLMIAANVIEAAHVARVGKLLYLGSSCIYPRDAPQPIRESSLLDGPLEPSNQWYAVAKIAGIKLCAAYRRQWGDDFISAQPTNLYGPDDCFDPAQAHVLPALMAKAHAAKIAGAPALVVLGTGRALREFLHADDLADACVFLLKHYSEEDTINIGSGQEISIAALARMIANAVEYRGDLIFDISRGDGAPRKLLDCSRMRRLGWSPRTSLQDGIRTVYRWFRDRSEGADGTASSLHAEALGGQDRAHRLPAPGFDEAAASRRPA
ncbi:GDP-L-fucose synthase [Constrictibacter sp. MBR-5]|jgi:GDP-L-fucose synthase|uniref:GDP-L-fucose synthase family protein n=1 Tax=Constrictibacter sp. MBR-5 TaxID=3156467 RepID=UPI003392F083